AWRVDRHHDRDPAARRRRLRRRHRPGGRGRDLVRACGIEGAHGAGRPPLMQSEAAATVAPRPHLIRAIGRWALTAAVINGVGSGIFGLPSALAGLTGAASPIAIVIAGASIFVIVLCFAEVGSRFDGTGGPYLYTREAFGPAVGFQVGWLHIWTRLLSAAAV